MLKRIVSITFIFTFLVSMIPITDEVYASNQGTNSVNKLLEELGYSKEDIKDLKENGKDVANEYFKNNGQMENLKLKKKDILQLANLGFTKQEILDFTVQDYKKFKDEQGQLVEVEKKYFKITKDGFKEYDKETALKEMKEEKDGSNNSFSTQALCDPDNGSCSDSEPSGWITLTTAVSKNTYASPDQYKWKHSYEWSSVPPESYTDAFGIAVPDTLTYIQDSEYMKQTADKWKSGSYDGSHTEYYYSANDKSGGIGFEFPLFGADYIEGCGYGCVDRWELKKHRGFIVYDTIWADSSRNSVQVAGGYIHTYQSLNYGLGVSVDGVSLSISSSVEKKDAIETGLSFYR